MNYLFRFSLLLLLTVSLSGCKFDMIKFLGVQDFKMPKMDEKEILLQMNVKVANPNGFGIKVKPSEMNVFVDEKAMGVVRLMQAVKFKRKSEGLYPVKLRVKLEKGALFNLMKYSVRKDIPVRFEGVVRGSAMGITRRMKINQSQQVDGSMLRPDNLFKRSE